MDFVTFLGKRLDEPAVARFLSSRRDQLDLSSYPDASVYHALKAEGICILAESGSISTVFLYSEGHEKYHQYQGRLPAGLRFTDTREEVIARLGSPSLSGAADITPVWDKYYRETWSLHISYRESGSILMVTLMSAERDPNRH